MSHERPLPTRPGDWYVDREDRLTSGEIWLRRVYRLRSRLLCLSGRHLWAHLRNPEVGGARAHYDQCRRCGRERSAYRRLEDLFGR